MLSIKPRNWKSDEDRRLFGHTSHKVPTPKKAPNLAAHQAHVARNPKDAQSSTHLSKRSA